MNKRAAGIILIALAVVLFIFRKTAYYIGEYMMPVRSGTSALLEPPYSYIPEILCLIAGIGYVIWSEVKNEK